MREVGARIACAVVALAFGSATFAVEKGDVLVRLGGTWVVPNDSSSAVQGIPGSGVGVDDAFTLGFTLGYMATDHIGIELLGIIPAKHTLTGEGTISALGRIGDTRVLPPTITFQYHFKPTPKIKPYVGVGVNYTMFFDENASPTLSGALGGLTSVDIDNSVGVAFQAGIDYAVTDRWMLNAGAWYIDLNADTTLTTGGITRKVDVDINPFVVFFGGGYRF